jgi:hypothetical protein
MSVRRASTIGWLLCLAFGPGLPALAQEPAQPARLEASPAQTFERVTRLLDRFRDVAVAEKEGYRQPWYNDGLMMGEQWFQPEWLRESVCDLERPAFLQYLMIDGQRTLIGVGYACDAKQPLPAGYGPDANWHRHGPELCRFRSGVFNDVSYYARSLPNALNADTWEDICSLWWAEPERRDVMMLHTWNWIPHPDGLFAHENRAIPFLRDGLRVRSQAELDTPEGQAALDTLRLAHGDETRRYEGAFLVADLGRFDAWMTRRLLRHGERLGEEAVARMRAAEQLGDPLLEEAAARDGAGALAAMRRDIAARLDPTTNEVMEHFLASLVVPEPHSSASVTHARAPASAQAPEQN